MGDYCPENCKWATKKNKPTTEETRCIWNLMENVTLLASGQIFSVLTEVH